VRVSWCSLGVPLSLQRRTIVLDKRIFYSGIGLATVLLLFLVLPLWLRNVDHPLAVQASIDVCAYFSDAVLDTLPQRPAAVARGYPGEKDASKPVCHADLPRARASDARAPNVWVGVTTERMLSAGGRPQRTDRYVETWLTEARMSGGEVTPVTGPWRRGAVIRESGHPEKLGLLADDAGVVIYVNGQGIEDPAFLAFAEALARGLRAKPAKR
jgi:hypothetical protein